MRLSWRVARLVLAGSLVLFLSTCDAFSGPEASTVEIAFTGDSVLVVGATGQVSIAVTVDGTVLEDPRMELIVDDPDIVALEGTELTAHERGTTRLTAQLLGSVLPDSVPTLSVVLSVVLNDVEVSPGTGTLSSLGETLQLAARGTDANDATVQSVAFTWATSDASVVTVDGDGLVTAVQNGSATISAVADQDTARATITVQQALATLVPDPEVLAFDRLGATASVTVEGQDGLGNPMSGITTTWRSLNTSIATVSTGGVVTAKGNGTTGIEVTSGAVKDTIPVTVDQAAVQVTIVATGGTEITSLGDKLQLAAGATDAAGNVVLDDQVTWSSLEPTLALVGPTGEVTGIGVGLAPITATLDEAADTVVIDVRNDPVDVMVTPSSATLASIDDSLQLQATARNGRGDVVQGLVFTWGVNDSAIIDIDNQGLAIAVGAGAVDVSARVDGIVGYAAVTVTNAPAVLEIAEASATVTSLGDTVIPTLTLTNARGAPLPANSITWVSDQEAIARVTVEGVVVAVDTGEARIRAYHDALADTLLVTVQNLPDSIELSSYLDTLPGLGAELQYGAMVWNARGAEIPDYPITWESTDGNILGVDGSGMVTGLAEGDAWLRVTAGSRVDSCNVVVKDLTLLHVDNSTVITPRFGTLKRPFAKIQDAINAADAKDTVYVHLGTGKYSESITLTKETWLLGDSTEYKANGQNPYYLPWIAHDTGAAAITIHTTAPQNIRFLTVVHSLDGPAVDADGATVRISRFGVNPWPAVSTRIGRGILIKNSISGSYVTDAMVYAVRGYGIRFENTSNASIARDTVWSVDSIPGILRGVGVEVINGDDVTVRRTVIARAEGPLASFVNSTNSTIQNNTFLGARRQLEVIGASGGVQTRIWNNEFDLSPLSGDETNFANPPPGLLIANSTEELTVWDNLFWQDSADNFYPRIIAVSVENSSAVGFHGDTIRGVWDGINTRRSWISFMNGAIDNVHQAILVDSAVNQYNGISINNVTLSNALEGNCLFAWGDSLRVEIVNSTLRRCGARPPYYSTQAVVVNGAGTGGWLLVEGSTFVDNPTTALAFDMRYAYFRNNTIVGPSDGDVGYLPPDYPDGWAGIEGGGDSVYVWENVISDFRYQLNFMEWLPYQGVRVSANTLFSLFHNRFLRNSVAFQYWGNGFPTFHYSVNDNDFVDNDSLAIRMGGAGDVGNTINNWYGDNRGPRRGGCDTVAACDVANEAAVGDSIHTLQQVDFEPFATVPYYPGTVATGLRSVRGDGQTGTAGNPLPRAFTVRVVDVDHKPVAGVSITFTITAGGGNLAGQQTVDVVSGTDGLVEVVLTPGSGTNTVEVTGTTEALGTLVLTAEGT